MGMAYPRVSRLEHEQRPGPWAALRRTMCRVAAGLVLLLLLGGCGLESLTGPEGHARYPSPPPGGMGPGSQVVQPAPSPVPTTTPVVPAPRPTNPALVAAASMAPTLGPRPPVLPTPAVKVLPSATPTLSTAQPAWLTTTRTTALLSGAHDPAVTFGTVPAGTRLELAAPPTGERLLIRNPATGGVAYVDASSVTTGSAPALAAASSPPPALQGTYRVRPGETLYRIARRYHLAVDVLARANGISDPRQVRAGQLLRLPASTGATTSTR